MSRRLFGLHSIRVAATLSAFLLSAAVAAEPGPARKDDVRGLWVDQKDPDKRKVGVWIEDCAGQLCGRIYWLKKPLSGGKPKRDRQNPDARLRDRPLCGLRILSGFRRDVDGAWNSGEVYNPNDGRTFSSTMTLDLDGGLRIRGYVGTALLGKTVEWVRPREKLPPCS